jgi:hypothetical protein
VVLALSRKIQEHLKEKDRKGFDLKMPLLEIPDKAEAQGENLHNFLISYLSEYSCK